MRARPAGLLKPTVLLVRLMTLSLGLTQNVSTQNYFPRQPAEKSPFIVPLKREWRKQLAMGSARHRQPSHNLFHHCVCSRGDLLWCLVLDGMLHVDGIKARTSQRAGLHTRRGCELSRRDGHSGNAQIL